MKTIYLNWADFKSNVDSRELKVQYYLTDITYNILAFDGQLCFETKIEKEDTPTADQLDFETNYLPNSNKKINNPLQNNPFSSKTVEGGKLYRRKHGTRATIPGNSTQSIKFTVPYTVAKVDEVEIINCSGVDTVDLNILDSATGTYTTIPNYLLNQFGFDVNVSDIYFTDTSNYDAELNIGMQIEILYTNNEADSKSIGINFVLHEVKAT